MSWRDRPYAQPDYDSRPPGRAGGFMGGMPRLGHAVKYLLIINVAMFLLQAFWGDLMVSALAVIPRYWWQLWRYVTFQFLHGSIMHIAFNMLALYFLGLILEATWGAKRFLVFYLTCGAIAGMTHVILTPVLNQSWSVPLLGASGGVFAVLLACTVLFPNVRVLVFFLFPMRLCILTAILLVFAFLNVMAGIGAAMAGKTLAGDISHPAHLGGAAAAAVWIWVLPRLRMKLRFGNRPAGQGRWEKQLKRRQKQQEEIDRILDKIRREGIGSLNRREKQLLQQTTEEMKND